MSAFGTRRVAGYTNQQAGTVIAGPAQPQIIPVFETDTSPFWRFLGILALAVAAFFIVGVLVKGISDDANYKNCVNNLCIKITEFEKLDGPKAQAEHNRAMDKLRTEVQAKQADAQRVQNAEIAAAILGKDDVIVHINPGGTRVVEAGAGCCNRGGAVVATNRCGLVICGGTTAAPVARRQYNLGDSCPMAEPYKGEWGWVWADGICHHLRPASL